jgi:hypothetical protein
MKILLDAYRLGRRGLSGAILSPDAWLKLLKSKNRIQEELYRRDPEWDVE